MAYGATAINPDISDIFVEQIKGDEYFYDGQWHKLKKVKEVIKVRFGSDYEIEYNFTHNGVLLIKPSNDKVDFATFFPMEFLTQNDLQYSWRWVYSEPEAISIFSLMQDLYENGETGQQTLKFF